MPFCYLGLSMRNAFRAALAAVLLVVPSAAHAAMSSDEKEATFWKVAVIDFNGRTPKVDGAGASVRFAAALRNSKRFHVVDPKTVRRAVREAKIDISQGKIADKDAKKLARELDIDGVFVGRIDKGALTIALHSGSTGRLFAQYRFNITAQFPRAEAEKIAKSYTARLPYDGLVVSVRRDLALVNLGTANGIGNGSKIYSFEFVTMTRDGDSVTGGERKAMAELEVVRAEQHGAWVRPLKGEMPGQFTKVSLKPVAGVAELKMAAPPEVGSGALPYVNLEVDADVAFLLKSYELKGDGARFTSSTSVFPAPGIRVLWFPTRAVGGSLRFRHGFIPFRRNVGDGAGGTRVQTFSGSVDTVVAEGQLRKVFGSPGYFAGGSASVGAGVLYSNFQIEEQNPLVLTNDTYIGPVVSAELRAPLLERINGHARFSVVPFAVVSEAPVDNGNGRGFGLGGTVGLEYHMTERMVVSFDYGLDTMQTSFPSGGGSRGITNAKSSDLYHGVTVTLGWRKYR